MNKTEKCIEETKEHISNVEFLLNKIARLLEERGKNHDRSKLFAPEVDYFAMIGRETLDVKYGTPEYQEGLDKLRPALNNHYAKNRHHPEHYPNGIQGMNLIDLVEMLADWKASTMRYSEGNLLTSIDINVKKFNICDDLAEILKNTAELLELV